MQLAGLMSSFAYEKAKTIIEKNNVNNVFTRFVFGTSTIDKLNKKENSLVASLEGLNEEDFEKDSFLGTCGICLGKLVHPSCPPCGHLFCYACIVECAITRRECPICRRSVPPNTIQTIYSYIRNF